MKIIVDLDNPDDVAQAVALLTGEVNEQVAETPAPPRAPAGRTAPGGAAAGRPAPAAAGRPAPGARPAPGKPAAPAAPEPDPAGPTQQDVSAAVTAYAKAYGPASAKARFAEYGASIGVAVTNISTIPTDDYANALLWFAVEG